MVRHPCCADCGRYQRCNHCIGTVSNCPIARTLGKTTYAALIRIRQLNKRKVQYLLTPEGFTEKMRKSVRYTLKTVTSISHIKERIKKVIVQLYYDEGHRDFTVLGRSDFALLISMVISEIELVGHRITYVDEAPVEETDGVLIICKENVDMNRYHFARVVDLVHELAKDTMFINHIGDLA